MRALLIAACLVGCAPVSTACRDGACSDLRVVFDARSADLGIDARETAVAYSCPWTSEPSAAMYDECASRLARATDESDLQTTLAMCETGCVIVANAYDEARARLGCAYDWPACPVTVSNEACVFAFIAQDSCSGLDVAASRCSR